MKTLIQKIIEQLKKEGLKSCTVYMSELGYKTPRFESIRISEIKRFIEEKKGKHITIKFFHGEEYEQTEIFVSEFI